MKIKVWSPQHLWNHAYSLCRTLIEMGHEPELTEKIQDGDDLYIIYCPQVCPAFPKNYIAYHTEHAERFLIGFHNKQIFLNAKQIWCHTPETALYLKIAYPLLECEIVPPGIVLYLTTNPDDYRPYDVTFYGNMSERRWSIVATLRLYGINVNLICPPYDVYGNKLMEVLFKSKVVLNLHYAFPAPLELFRIHEGLSAGCHVISENSSTEGFKIDYSVPVNFMDDPQKMILWINYLLSNNIKPNFDVTKLDNRPYIEEALKKLKP